MKQLFFKIYGGMILAAIFIAALLYAGLSWVNDYRLQQYLNRVAAGAITLIAEGVARHQGEVRKKWLNTIDHLANIKFELVARPDEIDTERLQVKAGLFNPSIELMIRVPGQERLYLRAEVSNVNEKISRVSALLILNELGRHKRSSRQNRLQELGYLFGFPLEIVAHEELSLSRGHQVRLARGDVVVLLNDTTDRRPYLTVIARYGNSGKLLKLGPIELFTRFPGSLISLAGLIAVTLLAVCGYFLLRPLERRLHRIGLEVENIGDGLVTQIPVEGDDAIARLAAKINDMSSRLHGLVVSQRDLVHAVSHELRTPVARMQFRIESMRGPRHANNDRRVIDRLQADVGELDQLLDEMLTYASLENVPVDMSYTWVNMQQLFEKMAIDPSTLSQSVGIEIQQSQTVHGVEHLLKRAVQNLLLNALRFGKTRVVLSSSQEKEQYRIVVADDGPGIPAEERERVFEPFFRLDKSRSRASGGYGLGLAIVKRIAEWHGGSISVYPSHHGGAKFVLDWPIHAVDKLPLDAPPRVDWVP